MLRRIFPFALSLILAACAYTTVSSPGKSDDAIRADMNSCDAGSLTLHNRPVIDCLSNHGDTITYDDGHIPPYTDGNPYDRPMTAAEVQQRKDAANVVLKRWQATIPNNAQNPGAAPPSQQMPGTIRDVNSYQAPASNPSTAAAPVPAATPPTPVAAAPPDMWETVKNILDAYNNNRPKFNRLYSGQTLEFVGQYTHKNPMVDISSGYVLFFSLRAGVMENSIFDTYFILCANVNDEATLDRVNGWRAQRVRVRGAIADADGGSLRLDGCKFTEQ